MTFTTFADVPALVVIVAVTVPLYVLPDWQVEQLLKLPLMVTLDVPPGPREVLVGLADNQPAFPSSHAIETVPVSRPQLVKTTVCEGFVRLYKVIDG